MLLVQRMSHPLGASLHLYVDALTFPAELVELTRERLKRIGWLAELRSWGVARSEASHDLITSGLENVPASAGLPDAEATVIGSTGGPSDHRRRILKSDGASEVEGLIPRAR
jgi:hypothetical protein